MLDERCFVLFSSKVSENAQSFTSFNRIVRSDYIFFDVIFRKNHIFEGIRVIGIAR